MLKPVGVKLVGAKDEKVILGKMEATKEHPGLRDQPTAMSNPIFRRLQSAGRLGNEMDKRRRTLRHLEIDGPDKFAADERAVHEITQSFGLKFHGAALVVNRAESRPVTPLFRQKQTQANSRLIDGNTFEVEQAGVPVDRSEVGRPEAVHAF